jgi:hypothetical protein
MVNNEELRYDGYIKSSSFCPDLTLQAAIDICRAEESAKLYPDQCKKRLKDTDKGNSINMSSRREPTKFVLKLDTTSVKR